MDKLNKNHYSLYWTNGNKKEVVNGFYMKNKSLCLWQREKIKEEPQYKKGILIVINENL